MLNEIKGRNSVEQSDGFHDGITNIFDVFDESETAKPSFSHHQFFCVRVSGGFYSFKLIPKDRFLRKSSWQFYYQMLNEIEARNSVEQSDGFHDDNTNIFDESETAKTSFSLHQCFCGC